MKILKSSIFIVMIAIGLSIAACQSTNSLNTISHASLYKDNKAFVNLERYYQKNHQSHAVAFLKDELAQLASKNKSLANYRQSVIENMLIKNNQMGMPDLIEQEQNQINSTLYSIKTELTWMFSTSVIERRYHLFDTKTNQAAILSDFLDPNNPKLKSAVRQAFYEYMLKNKDQGWYGTPITETERQAWLDKHIDDILKNHGALWENKLVYCSSAGTTANTFYGCIEIDGREFLKGL